MSPSRIEAIRPFRFYSDEFYDGLVDVVDESVGKTLKDMQHLPSKSEILNVYFVLLYVTMS